MSLSPLPLLPSPAALPFATFLPLLANDAAPHGGWARARASSSSGRPGCGGVAERCGARAGFPWLHDDVQPVLRFGKGGVRVCVCAKRLQEWHVGKRVRPFPPARARGLSGPKLKEELLARGKWEIGSGVQVLCKLLSGGAPELLLG